MNHPESHMMFAEATMTFLFLLLTWYCKTIPTQGTELFQHWCLWTKLVPGHKFSILQVFPKEILAAFSNPVLQILSSLRTHGPKSNSLSAANFVIIVASGKEETLAYYKLIWSTFTFLDISSVLYVMNRCWPKSLLYPGWASQRISAHAPFLAGFCFLVSNFFGYCHWQQRHVFIRKRLCLIS